MIDRQRDGDELREEFRVLGSTGNVGSFFGSANVSCVRRCIQSLSITYLDATVGVMVFACNWYHMMWFLGPDAVRGNHCKHIVGVGTLNYLSQTH
jgi:hypothetical protein